MKLINKILNHLKDGTLILVTKQFILFNINKLKDKDYDDFSKLIDINKNNLLNKNYNKNIYNFQIDIVIPIYNGYEYFDKLFKSLKKTNMNYRIILIEDNSSDKRVLPYLKEFQKKSNNVIILENKRNLGFVKSVNKGLRICKNNIALLNTDIELPEYWLERLMYPILFCKNVASSTPFTNCGTICSFPKFCEDNELFCGYSLKEIDNEFKLIKPYYKNMPTGVGFCMGINKKILDEIGLLDAKTFKKGYCEENDWCQRAIKSGYRNVHVENLFVYHKHGGSFQSDEKIYLSKKNLNLLLKRYPNYNKEILKYCTRDVQKNIRDYIIIKLLSKLEFTSTSIIFTNNLKNYNNISLNNIIKKHINNKKNIILIKYIKKFKIYHLDYIYNNYHLKYKFKNIDIIEKLFEIIDIKRIYINHPIDYPNLYYTLKNIIFLKNKYKSKLIILISNYLKSNYIYNKYLFNSLTERYYIYILKYVNEIDLCYNINGKISKNIILKVKNNILEELRRMY